MLEVAATVEPISPELILVDPVLADLVRGHPGSRPWIVSTTYIRPLGAPALEPVRRRPGGLLLAVTGAVAVLAAVAAVSQWRPGVPRPSFAADAAAEGPTVGRPAPRLDPARRLTVERVLLERLPAEAGQLVPRTVVDPASGTLQNNVRVSCRPSNGPSSFSCSVFGASGRRVAVLSAVAKQGERIVFRR